MYILLDYDNNKSLQFKENILYHFILFISIILDSLFIYE